MNMTQIEKYADELNQALFDVAAGVIKPSKLPIEPMVRLIDFVKSQASPPTDKVTISKAEYDALVADAERWKTLCELWLLCTEMSLIQNEDGGYSIIMVEPVDNVTFKDLVGDTPEQAIDSARKANHD
jgi:hypothetical protein